MTATDASPQQDIQRDADLVAVYLEGSLSGIPREFVPRVHLDQVQQISASPDEKGTTLDCAFFMAESIKKSVGPNAIQFIRMSAFQYVDGVLRAHSAQSLGVPVRAMIMWDVREGKAVKRFDVQFVIHRTD